MGQKHDKIEKALPGLSDIDQHVECPRSKRTDSVTKETDKEEEVCLGYSKTNGAGVVSSCKLEFLEKKSDRNPNCMLRL